MREYDDDNVLPPARTTAERRLWQIKEDPPPPPPKVVRPTCSACGRVSPQDPCHICRTPCPLGLKHGDPIPNSRFYRVWCSICLEPMQVNRVLSYNCCSKCDGKEEDNPQAGWSNLCARQKARRKFHS